MKIDPYNFVLLAFYSFCSGSILSLIYDLLLILENVFSLSFSDDEKRKLNSSKITVISKKEISNTNKTKNVLMNALEIIIDCVFVILCGSVSILLAFAYNDGKFRLVIFVCMILGFLTYRYTIGKIALRINRYLAFIVKVIVIYIYEIIKLSISKLYKFFVIHKSTSKIKRKKGSKEKQNGLKNKKAFKRKSKTSDNSCCS